MSPPNRARCALCGDPFLAAALNADQRCFCCEAVVHGKAVAVHPRVLSLLAELREAWPILQTKPVVVASQRPLRKWEAKADPE